MILKRASRFLVPGGMGPGGWQVSPGLPLPVALVLALMAAVPARVEAQGIRGVTRRTTTQELQAPARQFFDAAGINVNGAPAGAPGVAPPSATVVRPLAQPYLAAKPAGAVPLATTRPATASAPGAAVARPYVLGTMPRRPVVAGGAAPALTSSPSQGSWRTGTADAVPAAPPVVTPSTASPSPQRHVPPKP